MSGNLTLGLKRQTKEKLYADGWEHLQDELRLLDMRIQAQVVRFRSRQIKDLPGQFRGLAVSDSEVDHLLRGVSAEPTHTPQLNELSGAITQFEAHITDRVTQSIGYGVYLPLYVLARAFGLSNFERQCVVICLAAELDRKYETLFSYLNDDVTRKAPTVQLVVDLLGLSGQDMVAVNTYFEPCTPLYKHILTLKEHGHEQPAFVSRILKLDDRIRDFILGSDRLDERLYLFTEVVNPGDTAKPLLLNQGLQETMRRFFMGQAKLPERQNIVFYLHGPSGAGRKTQVRHFCHFSDKVLLLVDVEKLLTTEASLQYNLELLEKEVLLQDAILCFDRFELLLNEGERSYQDLLQLSVLLRSLKPVTFLIGDRPWKPRGILDGQVFIEIGFDFPSDAQRRDLWSELGSKYKYNTEVNWGEFAGKFRFTVGQIENALTGASHMAAYRNPTEGMIESRDIYRACYTQASHHLEKRAKKVVPRYTLADIEIPPEGKQLLADICNQVKYKHIVYGDWGFDKKLAYGKGLSAIFSGPPGTGKTMAAQIIAAELSLELYKIDLSQVMSKYIGETEKNLQAIFDEAESSNAILFFDEADALFGKRSEVKDARDRYANVEVAYLLQKVEEYSGVTILATNLMGNIDDAFMRRIQFVVEFPFPDAQYREKIWRIIFPEEAPLSEDVDYEFLADKLEISGGNIKNIAVAAAFYAAEQASPIGMNQIIRAARYEFKKMGKLFLKEEFGEYCFNKEQNSTY